MYEISCSDSRKAGILLMLSTGLTNTLLLHTAWYACTIGSNASHCFWQILTCMLTCFSPLHLNQQPAVHRPRHQLEGSDACGSHFMTLVACKHARAYAPFKRRSAILGLPGPTLHPKSASGLCMPSSGCAARVGHCHLDGTLLH